jgi:hypothetical protein
VAKNTEKRLGLVSEKIFEQIKSNDAKVKSAINTMKSKGDTTNHPRSQAIRERLQNMDYGEMRSVINSDDHVAGIFLSDPTMIYHIDEKQQAVIRDGLLNKHDPEAYKMKKSQNSYFEAYEAMLSNTTNLIEMMASTDDVSKVEGMRFEI